MPSARPRDTLRPDFGIFHPTLKGLIGPQAAQERSSAIAVIGHLPATFSPLGWADTVVKGFCASERAILIQDQAPIRNIDSKICSLRFDCCAQNAPRRLLQQYRHIAAVEPAANDSRLRS
jgi:hypothetical protein